MERTMKKQICAVVFLLLISYWLTNLLTRDFALAQAPDTKSSILLTIFLKHDQTKTLEEINKHLDNTGFWKEFPPEGTEVVSWYVMMGIGQVITLRVPADKLREVNLAIEKRAWGAYRSEFYATYDFRPVWQSTYRKK
jgi:hypothetical protein